MRLHLPATARRLLGTAFATAILAGSLAGTASAASPAAANADTDWRDGSQIAVLAAYPFGEPQSTLGFFEVRGPKVGWLKTNALEGGYVKWRLIVQTAPTKNGPWTTLKRTPAQMLLVSKSSSKTFPNRTVKLTSSTGSFVVRLRSKVTWHAGETTPAIGSKLHTYTKYGLVMFSGVDPKFGDQTMTRTVAPNIFPS